MITAGYRVQLSVYIYFSQDELIVVY